jgi:hypothetical protein
MSREIPYQPMGEPRKQVSQSDMQAILQKHAVRTGVPVPQPKPLEWNRPEKGATGVRTTCGRYSCSKVTVNDKTSYEVWKLVPDGSWYRQLAVNLESFDAAKRIANEDLQRYGGSGGLPAPPTAASTAAPTPAASESP